MRSLRGPIILYIFVLVFTITLTVLWNVILVRYYLDLQKLTSSHYSGAFHWTFISLGSAFFTVILVGSSVLLGQLVGQIRRSRQQSNFVASVSHELNSPLSAIKLFAQTLKSGDVSPAERRAFLDNILTDVERLKQLIGNILRTAELEHTGELRVIPQPLDFDAFLTRFVESARAVAKQRGTSLELIVGGDEVGTIQLDGLMFQQVLENLVDNAVRYSGSDSATVAITTIDRGDEIELRLADEGIGLKSREARRVFERFYQVTPEKRTQGRQGTGIGLFVVRSIVEAHQGEVWMESEGPGRGSTVIIRLPRRSEDGEGDSR